jgi:hypothetical protein
VVADIIGGKHVRSQLPPGIAPDAINIDTKLSKLAPPFDLNHVSVMYKSADIGRATLRRRPLD